MRTLLIILFSLFQTFAFSQSNGWWYGNGSSAAPAGPDTLTLTYWNDFVLLHIQNTGITETGSGVSEWQDRSGNGNHSTQTTDANRPTVDGSGNVVFDGVDNYLDATDVFTNTNDTAFTFFLVWEHSSASNLQRIYSHIDQIDAFTLLTLIDSVSSNSVSTRAFLYDNVGVIDLRYLDTFNINTANLLTVAARESSTVEARINGVQKATDTVSSPWNNSSAANDEKIGSNADGTVGFFNGKIKFIGIANRKFSPAEIATTESELNSFFTIY